MAPISTLKIRPQSHDPGVRGNSPKVLTIRNSLLYVVMPVVLAAVKMMLSPRLAITPAEMALRAERAAMGLGQIVFVSMG